ncbi:efflux RND transporter permease subunit, partial [Phenylobacterium sp.]|uniref:efflux RND transporter permease subunit n=1 Tax=Phenylobacterium sp. TaxID=1871053 RepID=UPI00374DC35B
MISRIFIDRPVFAWVIALVIMLVGLGAIRSLPVEQYPDIAPPQVNIRAAYPGASAEVIENSVTQVIEQQLTGIDGMIYFSSNSASTGQVNITVTFKKGTNPDIAQVQVQNKVQQALPRLPQEVQAQGLGVTKANPDFLLITTIYDTTDRAVSSDIADYVVTNLQEKVGRLPGVGDINVFGAPYAMRIWLDPFKLAAVRAVPGDVITAIREQNTQVAAGQIGGLPSAETQMLSATVTAHSRLTTPEQFRKIIIKTKTDGSRVLLQDVARIELGSENYGVISRLNGHPAAGIGVNLAPGADALQTADLVRGAVAEQAKSFPPGYQYIFPNDSTAFIKLSIREVVQTLAEAILLVVLVMFVFLQSWRATLIPAIAVPVVLLGTFGVMSAAGYSINTLTLFGLVLAIGLLVDDAIVVVENVERVMQEEGLSPKEATRKSMDQISGALVGIGLVLSAAFVPMAFFTGSSGVIYRQFSLTIVSSVVLSVLVALILTPALCATLLKPVAKDHGINKRGPFGWFNRAFERTADHYTHAVGLFLKHYVLSLIPYIAIAIAVVFLFERAPTGFLPDEDTGV